MKYRNASNLFPDELLREIQKYSSGELIYIPKAEDKMQWGEKTGAKKYYSQRNNEIREKYRREKKNMEELSSEYGLSYETIRRIVYR